MRSPVQAYLEELSATISGGSGQVAQYIPELAAADPDRFAMCLATVDGQVYEVGETAHRFSIQSISKPFTYALALNDQGLERVEAKVGVEPSGDAFNEISLAPDSGRPKNPMINAGAIATSALVEGETGAERFHRVRDWFSDFAGRNLALDEAIYESEINTAHRNRAIAHMLREFGILETDPEEVLDQYIKQCSLAVDTRDLALMAATLANRGTHPVTGERIVNPAIVEYVLSVMTTCGMYDAAGDWVSTVGMPAKSGVSGGIIGVLPGQIGVAIFSPRLDEHGNSERGVALFERLSMEMELHMMHVSRGSESAVRRSYSLADRPSATPRDPRDQQILETYAERVRVFELHGDLLFAGGESVVRSVVNGEPEVAILDFRHVNDVAQVTWRMFMALHEQLLSSGIVALVVDPDGVVPRSSFPDQSEHLWFVSLEAAIEVAENELIVRHGGSDACAVGRSDTDFFLDLDDELKRLIAELTSVEVFGPGEVVQRRGEPFSGVYRVMSGRVEILGERAHDSASSVVSMGVIGPGRSFGMLPLGADAHNEIEIRAITQVEARYLSLDGMEQITARRPELGAQVWRAIAAESARLAVRAMRRGD